MGSTRKKDLQDFYFLFYFSMIPGGYHGEKGGQAFWKMKLTFCFSKTAPLQTKSYSEEWASNYTNKIPLSLHEGEVLAIESLLFKMVVMVWWFVSDWCYVLCSCMIIYIDEEHDDFHLINVLKQSSFFLELCSS